MVNRLVEPDKLIHKIYVGQGNSNKISNIIIVINMHSYTI